jgi:hypothetical protein
MLLVLLVMCLSVWHVLCCSSMRRTPIELPAGAAAVLGCPVLPHVGHPVGCCMGTSAVVVVQGSPATTYQRLRVSMGVLCCVEAEP